MLMYQILKHQAEAELQPLTEILLNVYNTTGINFTALDLVCTSVNSVKGNFSASQVVFNNACNLRNCTVS